MKPTVIYIAVITALVIALITMATCWSNSGAKAEKQLLKVENDSLASQVKALSVSEMNAKQRAYNLQYLYMVDTAERNTLQQQFDSLSGVLSHFKIVSHAQIKAIANLSDAATDSLYAINRARFTKIIATQ